MNYYDYPDGDAGALRVRSLARMFSAAGHECLVFGMGSPVLGLVEGDPPWTSLRRGSGRMGRAADRVLFVPRLSELLRRYGSEVSCVVFSDLPLAAVLLLRDYATRSGAMLVHDSVEWYSPGQFTLGRLDWRYVSKDLLNRYLVRPPVRVTAISTFLERHFLHMGCSVARIPPILNPDEFASERSTDSSVTRFLYAGSPGRKDCLEPIVAGFLGLTHDERAKSKLTFMGIDARGLARRTGIGANDAGAFGIFTCGRVSHQDVLDELRRTDFTILIRDPRQRVAQAGFPTKVVESLMCGTPVLCNDTSDIFRYLEDGREAIRVEHFGSVATTAAMRTAITMGTERKRQMQRNARLCAVNHFAPEAHVETIRRLVGIDPDK